jgi:hypothetical protein
MNCQRCYTFANVYAVVLVDDMDHTVHMCEECLELYKEQVHTYVEEEEEQYPVAPDASELPMPPLEWIMTKEEIATKPRLRLSDFNSWAEFKAAKHAMKPIAPQPETCTINMKEKLANGLYDRIVKYNKATARRLDVEDYEWAIGTVLKCAGYNRQTSSDDFYYKYKNIPDGYKNKRQLAMKILDLYLNKVQVTEV